MITGYKKSISEATGVTDPEMLERIEDTMRHIIFHSTLDWQTKKQFDKGAREAYEVIQLTERMEAENKKQIQRMNTIIVALFGSTFSALTIYG